MQRKLERVGYVAQQNWRLLWQLARFGKPSRIFCFNGGLGDDFLCSVAIRELKLRGEKNLWMLSFCPELFKYNPYVDLVLKRESRGLRHWFDAFNLRVTGLNYAPHVDGRDLPPKLHIISEMCRIAGVKGEILRRPFAFLQEAERWNGRLGERQMAIQSSGMAAKYNARTKEWLPERFQQIVERYRDRFTMVQVGSAVDPPLTGTIDLRGKTSVRETAAILANSTVFIGLAGFLQHLARSVECRSVIVYGGRELPTQTGYCCNENVTNNPECSPCWLYQRCAHEVKCMSAVEAPLVVEAVERQLSRAHLPLEEDKDLIVSPGSVGRSETFAGRIS